MHLTETLPRLLTAKAGIYRTTLFSEPAEKPQFMLPAFSEVLTDKGHKRHTYVRTGVGITGGK